MKILFLSHHWTHNSHHSLHSGMQRMVACAAETNDVTLVTWGPEDQAYIEGKVRVITVRAGGKDYLFSKRLAISRKGAAIAASFDVLHPLFSDCSFHLPRNRFTVTLHVLPAVVRYKEIRQNLFLFLKYHLIQKRAFRRAKHIACVATNLLEALPRRYQSKACFIPHGVDTDFWDPGLAKAHPGFQENQYVLCVGAHGLDRDLLADFIRANPTLSFVFVGIKTSLGNFPNTHYMNNLPDEELRDLYYGCALMLRPLLFATANNSLLEALAMGKTILASRIPGVTDYLTADTCVFIEPANLNLEPANLKLDPVTLRLDPASLRLDPAALRQTAIQKFGWRKVLASYLSLYNR